MDGGIILISVLLLTAAAFGTVAVRLRHVSRRLRAEKRAAAAGRGISKRTRRLAERALISESVQAA